MTITVQYQFTNRFNWSIFYDQIHTAPFVNPALTRFNPIPKIQIGYTIDSPILAIYCANSEAPNNWRYGASYLAKMLTTLTIGGVEPDSVIANGKIYLNQVAIIQLPPFSTSYALEFDIPYWHREFQLKIWEYTGNNQNSLRHQN